MEKRPDVWPVPDAASAESVARSAPSAAPDHPGNVFLLGEDIDFPACPDTATWRLTDDAAKVVAEGSGARVSPGKLGVGWYRCACMDAQGNPLGFTTAAVLAPVTAPTPQDSPVCLDSASAWFARDDPAKQERFARLAALAGANWIRDRMSWDALEPERGAFAPHTTYDTSADIQTKHGLKILQVFHRIPSWAADANLDGESARGRFPRDLRDHYAFCKAMAERYKGHVLAWEPWNEANILNFGGHTIDEMCSLQKAAYWGLKQGDPEVIACWNVFAGGGNSQESEGVIRNETWPYFDTYNIHTYDPPESYLRTFAHARDAASGRPVWLSECGIGLHFVEGSKEGELTPELELDQARFIARSYASSLFAGVNRHFFFILGNYLENVNQFGLLRHDQTPRPGYVALAAVGRFLAGAQCIGRMAQRDKDGPYVYAFRARPDGVDRDVVIAWAKTSMNNSLPADLKLEGAYDYLGRPCAPPSRLNTAAAFLVLVPGALQRVTLEPLPHVSAYREGTSSPVVMQLEMPAAATFLGKQAHLVAPDQDVALRIWVYNFGEKPVAGAFKVEDAPKDWRVQLPDAKMELAPLERKALTLHVRVPSTSEASASGAWIALRGDFGTMGRPVLAFRLAGASDHKQR